MRKFLIGVTVLATVLATILFVTEESTETVGAEPTVTTEQVMDPVPVAPEPEPTPEPTTTTVPPPPPLAPPCSTWASQAEVDEWMAVNAAIHDVSNIDTNGDGVACTLHFAPPPAPAAPAAPSTNGSQATASGGCAVPGYICHRESRGDPNAVNPTGCSGRGCYGKYQFDPNTWNAVARDMGRPDLVGNAAGASEADQDAVAAHLWDGGNGCSHWAAC